MSEARWGWLVILVGCGGGAKGTPVVVAEDHAEETKPTPVEEDTTLPVYRALREAGGTWRYRFDRETQYYDASDERADQDGLVTEKETGETTCKITEVVEVGAGRRTHIGCDPDPSLGFSGLVGDWGFTPDGMYQLEAAGELGGLGTLDDQMGALQPSMLVIGAVPVVSNATMPDPLIGNMTLQLEVLQKDGRWCSHSHRTDDSYPSDQHDVTTCYANGAVVWSEVVRFFANDEGDGIDTLTFTRLE